MIKIGISGRYMTRKHSEWSLTMEFDYSLGILKILLKFMRFLKIIEWDHWIFLQNTTKTKTEVWVTADQKGSIQLWKEMDKNSSLPGAAISQSTSFQKGKQFKLNFLPIRVPDRRSSSSKACFRAAADQSSWSLSSVLCPALSVCPAFSLKFRLTLCWITLNWWIYFVLGQQVFYSSLNKTLHASSFFQSIFNYVWTRISFLTQPISLAPFKF